jgi:serine/threonine protein kinase
MTLERGSLLHGRYRIIDVLGQGGMGFVYRAIDENLGVEVAVKENIFTTDEYARQFHLEAVILANMRHPNMTRVTDHFVIENQGQYLVMDYIEGEDLRQRMDRQVTITEEDAIMIGSAMCDALTHLHSRIPPILHRDIKPGNVKITSDGHIFLVDFGLAKILKGSEDTTSGARAMTPGYSPPEQYGTARTDIRSDIYSLGATLYAALTGVVPEDALARIMDNIELTPLYRRSPHISQRLVEVIEKAMSLKADDRFQTAEDFKQALINSRSGSVLPKDDSQVEPSPVPVPGEKIRKSDERLPVSASGSVQSPAEQPPVPPLPEKKFGKGPWIILSILLMLVLLLYLIPKLKAAIFPNLFPSPPTSTTLPISTSTFASTVATGLPIVPVIGSPTLAPTSTRQGFTPPARSPTNEVMEPTATHTPVLTPVGGGGGQFAFSSDRSGIPQIFVSSLNVEDPQQITNLTGGACQPDWSPDGQQLIFISPCDKNTDTYPDARMYTIKLDGSDLTELPTVAGGDFDPAWSPDGTRIAFTSLRDGFTQIYTFNLDDNSVSRLTQTEASSPARQPAWNSTATEIAYSQKKDEAWEIWLMTDLGKEPSRLVLSSPDHWDMLPDWSPDGNTVLFTQSRKLSATGWLMTFPRDGSTNWAVSVPNGEYAWAADYSLDGNRLIFENTDGLNSDIFMLDLATGLRQPLTTNPARDFDPVWRP